MLDLIKDPNIVTLLITLVVLAVGLLKIIDVLIKFVLKKISPKNSILSKEETVVLNDIHEWVEELHEKSDEEYAWLKELKDLHSRCDADGIPLWYVPRSLVEMQKEMVSILLSISNHQSKTTYVLESLVTRIDKIEGKD